MSYQDDIRDLIRQPGIAGSDRVPYLAEAIRIADAHQDDERSFMLRSEFLDEAGTGGIHAAQALTHFVWMMDHADKNREAEYVTTYSILWKFKWIVGNLASFPDVSLEQVESIFNDMTRRYEEEGCSLRPIHKARSLSYQRMGMQGKAAEHRELWLAARRDYMNDCPACEQNSEFTYVLGAGDWETAYELGGPILRGRLSCKSVPHSTYARALMLLLRMKKREEAVQAHRKGYRLVRNRGDHLLSLAYHLQFLALTGNEQRGKDMMLRHLPWALKSEDPEDAFYYYLYSALLLGNLARASQRRIRRMQPPPDFPGWREDGVYELDEVQQTLIRMARDLAVRFDTRNGNSTFMNQVDGMDEWEELRQDWPLKERRLQEPDKP